MTEERNRSTYRPLGFRPARPSSSTRAYALVIKGQTSSQPSLLTPADCKAPARPEHANTSDIPVPIPLRPCYVLRKDPGHLRDAGHTLTTPAYYHSGPRGRWKSLPRRDHQQSRLQRCSCGCRCGMDQIRKASEQNFQSFRITGT